MQIFNYRFQPKLIPTLATLLLLPLLLNLGLWQANKADKKQAMQDIYDQRGQSALVQIGAEPLNLESIRFSRVVARGYFEPAYQILLDNQIYKGQAGYHVITPLHIAGSTVRVLVNRGWVPVGADRNNLPVVATPQSEVEVTGDQSVTPLLLERASKIKKDLTVVPAGFFCTITGLTPFLQSFPDLLRP